ncbi:MAG TPA: glycosyltransferase family 4 protein [Candidatus Thermoplasmatota archaeon]|nr:glycosyltransferase family 4 protein [Candidatus Thermoplasmatota archaeon]
MRLLLTAHRFHPHVGGTETAVEQLATHFARAGHDVTVATSAEPAAPEREERDGYHVRRFPMRVRAGFRVPPPDYRRLVVEERWDVVHMHGQRIWSSDFLYPHLRRARSSIVFTAHGFAQWHRDDRVPLVDHAYYHLVLPRALRHVSCVTALTDAERRDLVGFGVPEDKIVRIGDGYDPSEFAALPTGFRARHGLAPDERVLLYAGGFYANKRVDRLVEACAGVDATLVVLGKDADGSQARVEGLARERGTRLRALGRVPRGDVLSAYREADLFLLGSDFEGYGLVLLEAMAAGLPFVSTPCGAAPDLAAHGGGVVVADARAMRAEVERLLADHASRQDMARKGMDAARRYTWESIAQEYLSLFEEVSRP